MESKEKTEKLVKALVKRNIVVNAGLARGIDTITHKTALQNNGRTIAVIRTPINQYYPRENKEIQLAIEKYGIVRFFMSVSLNKSEKSGLFFLLQECSFFYKLEEIKTNMHFY